jgi:uncharacterized membrane protein YedE/YeeE
VIGAIAVYFMAYRWSRRMPTPLLTPDFSLPKRSELDAKLVMGAAIFGAGWGLGGFCPGPALISLASGALPVFVFVIATGIGMYLHTWATELGTTTSGVVVSSAESTQDA